MKLPIAMILTSMVFLGACDKSTSGSDLAKPDTAAVDLVQPTPEAEMVDTQNTDAQSAVKAEGANLLATLSDTSLSISSPELSGMMSGYFKDGCSAGSAPLTFEQTCEHYAENSSDQDPSPWPDLMVGISNKEVASAVLFSSEQSLGDNWQCDSSTALENVRYCYPKKVTPENRERWSKEWAAYFAAAD